MLVAILLGVLTLTVLVGAYFASSVWHWAHVTLLVLLFLSSTGYLILASQTLALRAQQQKVEFNTKRDLERTLEELRALSVGSKDPSVIGRLAAAGVTIPDGAGEIGGLVELRHRTQLLNRDRGRVLRGVEPTALDQQSGAVTVSAPVAVAAPSEGESADPTAEAAPAPSPAPAADQPLGLSPNTVVFVFEQGAAVPRDNNRPTEYVGQFRVASVEGRTAVLEPLKQLALDPYAAQRLRVSRGPWIVYEAMPADSTDLFLGMDEARLKQLLPEKVVAEYLRDGGPASDDDDPMRREGLDADGQIVGPDAEAKPASVVYRRLPRDYAFLLQDLDKEQAEMVAVAQGTQADLDKLAAALEGAKALGAMRQDELGKLRGDLAGVKKDRAAIEAHAATLQAQAAKAKRLLDQTLALNAQLASERAARQGLFAPEAPGALDVDAL